jgi:hypothetical protein
MRKLVALAILILILGLSGFLFSSGSISVSDFSDWLNFEEDVEGREFQSGGEATDEEISAARSELQEGNWEYEETKTSDNYRKLSFNDGDKSAEVVLDSKGKLIEQDMEADGISDGSDEVVYEEEKAIKKARESLYDRNWSLESNILLEGNHNLRFTSPEYDANIKIDGSSGDLIRKKVMLRNSSYNE